MLNIQDFGRLIHTCTLTHSLTHPLTHTRLPRTLTITEPNANIIMCDESGSALQCGGALFKLLGHGAAHAEAQQHVRVLVAQSGQMTEVLAGLI